MKLSDEAMRRALRLYAVTDRRWLKEGETIAAAAEKALRGGATMLQLREKELDEVSFAGEAAELQELCRRFRVPFIVNDRVEIALAVDADGVHLGQEDLKGRDIRALIGPDKIFGVTAKTIAQAKAAEASGADYIGVGAIFGSSTKADAAAISASELRNISEAVRIPLVAIGGINAGNIPLLRGSGASGVAAVSGIFAAEDPAAAAKELLRLSLSFLSPEALP